MSGFGLSADRARSGAAGYRYHLAKSFLPEELDPILAEAIAQRNLHPPAAALQPTARTPSFMASRQQSVRS